MRFEGKDKTRVILMLHTAVLIAQEKPERKPAEIVDDTLSLFELVDEAAKQYRENGSEI